MNKDLLCSIRGYKDGLKKSLFEALLSQEMTFKALKLSRLSSGGNLADNMGLLFMRINISLTQKFPFQILIRAEKRVFGMSSASLDFIH